MKAALAKGDASGLGAVAASANSVQARAEALNALEARIRRSTAVPTRAEPE